MPNLTIYCKRQQLSLSYKNSLVLINLTTVHYLIKKIQQNHLKFVYKIVRFNSSKKPEKTYTCILVYLPNFRQLTLLIWNI